MRNVTRRTQYVPEIEAIGLAMLMRGKSLTCRKKLIIDMAVYDRGSETPEMRNFHDGKSETCRASEWRSHDQVASLCFEVRDFKLSA